MLLISYNLNKYFFNYIYLMLLKKKQRFFMYKLYIKFIRSTKFGWNNDGISNNTFI